MTPALVSVVQQVLDDLHVVPLSADDLAEALALAPEHLSLYELEAKPGTRFTHAFGDELSRQSEAPDGGCRA